MDQGYRNRPQVLTDEGRPASEERRDTASGMMTIKRGVAGIVVVLALIVGAAATYAISDAWSNSKKLRAAAQAIGALTLLSEATIELSLERSLTQVALNLDPPVSDQIKGMMDRQRTLSTKLF